MTASRCRCACLWLVIILAAPVHAEPDFSAMASLPPGEQYRRLSLMRLAATGVTPDLRDAIAAAVGGGDADEAVQEEVLDFDPDEYTTPLARIVGRASLLEGALALFEFTAANDDAIRARMATLEAANPVLISMLDGPSISEDAILVRSAIADAIADQWTGGAASTTTDADRRRTGMDALEAYRVHTVFLRNEMEFDDFDAALGRVTRDAIASVGGQAEAYQRMFEDETVDDSFDRQIQAAESVYTKEPIDVERAGELAEDLVDDIMSMENDTDVDP